jgi:FkbM family methyltransferase
MNIKIFYETLDSAIKRVPGNQILANKFLSDNFDIGKYVIGKNEQSMMLINSLKIDGIIDDYADDKSFWEKTPVIKSTQIPPDAIVVNCSTSISPVSVSKNIKKVGVKNLINLHEVLYAAKGSLTKPRFMEQMQIDYRENLSEWFRIYELMSDQESQKTLLDIMCYRLTADPAYMNSYTVRLNQQYLEDFMHYSSEVFVDIGGFDGDTTEEFCKNYSDYKKVFLFEPSAENISSARIRLAQFTNIEFFTCGLSDEPGTLSFNPDAGSASAIMKEGSSTIDVTTLDIKIKEQVSFIKMDIEGWELKALAGCRNHIVDEKPKMAIAVYHNSSDFYRIANYILSLNAKYKLYLRHYTEGWSETVMYFVP